MITPKDFDEATKELCQECAIIRTTIPKDSIYIKITEENHRAHWQWAKKETSSSFLDCTLATTWPEPSRITLTTYIPLRLELLTNFVFLVGIRLVFRGFYQTDTGG